MPCCWNRDCDEQSNAFMSIMRVKGIPTWYVFGALTDPQFNEWEGPRLGLHHDTDV